MADIFAARTSLDLMKLFPHFSFRVCLTEAELGSHALNHYFCTSRFHISVHNDSVKRHLRLEELNWKIKHGTVIIPK